MITNQTNDSHDQAKRDKRSKVNESEIIRNHPALKNQSSVDPESYPDTKAGALQKPRKKQ